MNRTIQYPIMLSEREKLALIRLAKMRELNQADIIRQAIQREAREAGLWPVEREEQDAVKA